MNTSSKQKRITPLSAIKEKCLDCCCGSAKEVRLCPSTSCPLFLFRTGHLPFSHKRSVTPEEQERLVKQLEEARRRRGGSDA